MRRIIRKFGFPVLSLLALAPVLYFSAAPAQAGPYIPGQPPNTMCESFGPQNCMGSDDQNYGTLIEERNPYGRTIRQNGSPGCTDCILLDMGNNKCIGLNSGDRTSIKVCSGTTAIVWTTHTDSGGHVTLQNNYNLEWFTCSGVLNDYCFGWRDRSPPPGYLQKFDMPGQ